MLIRVTRAAVAAVVLVYALLVIHGFYRTVDRAVYLAVDDGLANIAYALGTEGRYGFLSSPRLVGLPRTHGQFNYGPWYFYLAGLLVWLFGYSLTLVRSIHLWVIVSAIAFARWWFGARPAAMWGIFGLGALYAFAQHEWPMVRPDSFVSAFAVLFVMAAGAAIARRSAVCWFFAGLTATCGALTHLIASGLVPAALLVWAVAMLTDRESSREARIRSGVALGIGIATALTMFYASFGFRLGDQLAFLRAYREVTRSSSAAFALDTGYTALVRRHFWIAFGEFPPGTTGLVLATMGVGWAMVLLLVGRRGATRDSMMTFLLPPLAAWTAYALSVGWYANLHGGYAILSHVLWLWTATAVVVVVGDLVDLVLPPMARRLAAAAVNLAVVAAGVSFISSGAAIAEARAHQADGWIGASEYVHEVLAPLPERRSAWGSLIFGIENPTRVQLVQTVDAVWIARDLPANARAGIAPELILWGYPDNFANSLAVVGGHAGAFASFDDLFPEYRYRLVGLVAAEPYGVTRLYQREPAAVAYDATVPIVSAYDVTRSRWSRRVGAAQPAAFEAVAPQRVSLSYGETAERTADSSLAADVPEGRYLLRVALGRTGTASAGLVTVSSRADLREVASELGPPQDFAPYGARDREVFLVHRHPGGRLFLSRFDNGDRLDAADPTIFRIEPLGPDQPQSIAEFRPLNWRVVGGARAVAEGSPMTIEGEATQYGYQLMTQRVDVAADARVTVRLDLAVDRGRVCAGVLDTTQQKWIVVADRLASEYTFNVGSSAGFYVVLANCNGRADGNERTRLTLVSGSYAVADTSLYSDRLIEVSHSYRSR